MHTSVCFKSNGNGTPRYSYGLESGDIRAAKKFELRSSSLSAATDSEPLFVFSLFGAHLVKN